MTSGQHWSLGVIWEELRAEREAARARSSAAGRIGAAVTNAKLTREQRRVRARRAINIRWDRKAEREGC